MKYVKATINSVEYYLQELPDGTWSVLAEAPSYPGVYPVTVTAEAQNGLVVIVGYDDAELGEYLRLLVLGEPRTQLLPYLPLYSRQSGTYQELMKTVGLELDRFRNEIQTILDDAFVLSAAEDRIEQMEKDLSIIPAGTLEQRKTYIISILRGQGKLNEARIKSIVSAFTGGDAIVTFANSSLMVRILSPALGDVYRFPDVERSLRERVPAHIGLNVIRYYSTWGDVKENFSSWATVASLADWKEVKNYLP